MTIKSTVNQTPKKREYPYIGVSEETGAIVLFYEENTGVYLRGGRFKKLGEHSDEFAEFQCFKPFNGTVTLENV